MIRENLRALEAIVRNLTDLNTALDEALIVAITDVRGNIKFVNERFCQISKYSRTELLGQNHRIINSGYHSKAFFREMWRTIANGRIWTGELKNRAKDGSFYWMHTIIVPLLNDRGKPYEYVSFRTEITARKLEEEKLDALIATMPDVVVFLDGDGRWLKANDAARALFHIDSDVYRGRTTAELRTLRAANAPALCRVMASDEAAWDARGPHQEEIEVPNPEGSLVTLQMTKVPVYHNDGQRSGMVLIGRDVTAQKRTAEALRRSETIAAVGQLASGIAHEVRNPLAGIKWAVEVLRAKHPDSSEQIDLILKELDRVDGIVGELLMAARPHATQFGYVNVHDVIQSVVTLMNGHARRNRVDVRVEEAQPVPPIYCEPHRLKQVFINLVKNGIEAMDQGGCLRISAARRDTGVVVRVADEGHGIPDDVLTRLGQPFVTTKEQGTGLGLMVTQQIVQEHQGSLTFHRNTPHGTVVEVWFPRATDGQSISGTGRTVTSP
ncbi:MAG: PAS domain S-box protein [Alicyclobacillus sp.]|nr:PAS domain S-box protein [Alicyclobacillus sp.]